MMVYRTVTRMVDPREIRNLATFDSHEHIRRFLIHFGEIEAAVADDGRDEKLLERCREVSLAAAQLLCSPETSGVERTRRLLDELALPGDRVQVCLPEGYAYYGLYPESYSESALQFFEAKRPDRVVCVGIRSIGTSLSAVVAATLAKRGCQAPSWTVRPAGHPFERRLSIPAEMERIWREWSGAHFLIIDEGPGLSGSSFAAVADKISDIGVPDDRINFLPSRNVSEKQFISERAQQRWRRHDKYYFAAAPRIGKFAGLGQYGEHKLEIAQQLADAGFSPPIQDRNDGYLMTQFIPGEPLRAGRADRELLDTIARYLAFRRNTFARVDGTAPEELQKMIECNTGIQAEIPESASFCLVDGRMLPQKWIATGRGYLKVDSLDHGDNHFYPGPSDIAWDVAGAIVEFGLEDDRRDYLIQAYMRATNDRSIRERLPFYRTAYLAFNVGYATLHGYRDAAERYRAALGAFESVVA